MPTKFRLVKAMVFPVVKYGCESWTIKKAGCWRIDDFELALEKTLESPLDNKEIQPVHPKGSQSLLFIGRTDAEVETAILWPPDVKNWLTRKDTDAGKDWRWEEKGTTEDEMAGWHHWLDGHESEWAPGVGDGQGSLECCSLWDCKESDTTGWLNWTELILEFVAISFSREFSPPREWTHISCIAAGFCTCEPLGKYLLVVKTNLVN